jgi:hypothetical protein
MENHVKEARTKPADSHQTKDDGLLTTAARKIGSAAGVVVSLTGMHQTAAQTKTERSTGNGKFSKKNKTRMPRRLKKALQKTSSNGHPVSA